MSALVLVLFSLANAQRQELAEPYKKWLECDVDWLFTKEAVGPDFLLKISFQATPIAGARVNLVDKDGKVAATAITNHKGVARFVSIPPGLYGPESPDGLLFPTGTLMFEVEAKRASGERLSLDWPSLSLGYRFLRGRFTTSDEVDDPGIPLRNAVVELRDIYTARLIESSTTDTNGDYQFSTTETGLYALRLVLSKKGRAGLENRDVAVELDPSARENSIPEMKVFQSDCNGVELLLRSARGDAWEAQ